MSDKTPRPTGGPKAKPDPAPGPPAPPGSAKASTTSKTSKTSKVGPKTSKVTVTEAQGGSTSPRPTPRTVADDVRESDATRTFGATEAADPEASTAAQKRSRRAHLRLVSVDPWSVTKVTFALSVALGVVVTVAISILWVVLGVSGIWDSINNTVSIVLANDVDSFDITEYVGYGRVIGLTLIVSAINVILVTAIATIGAYLYNLAAQLVGGLHVTLSDEN